MYCIAYLVEKSDSVVHVNGWVSEYRMDHVCACRTGVPFLREHLLQIDERRPPCRVLYTLCQSRCEISRKNCTVQFCASMETYLEYSRWYFCKVISKRDKEGRAEEWKVSEDVRLIREYDLHLEGTVLKSSRDVGRDIVHGPVGFHIVDDILDHLDHGRYVLPEHHHPFRVPHLSDIFDRARLRNWCNEHLLDSFTNLWRHHLHDTFCYCQCRMKLLQLLCRILVCLLRPLCKKFDFRLVQFHRVEA